jgi:hypothetical protein
VKLGVLVVYLVKPENAELLDLHLNKIRALTSVPYTIYAGLSSLAPPLLQRLRAEPGVELVQLRETDLSGSPQHSLYLEQLIERALKDDVTHLVTLHVDSFPIRAGWAETIASRLTGDTVLATLSNNDYLIGYTAGLFFRRDFWEDLQPAFLLSEEDRAAPEYQRFSREHPHYPADSGVGFVFRAYSRGKAFAALERSDAGRGAGTFASIHGDLIFHLGGAYRYEKLSGEERSASRKAIFKMLTAARGRVKKCIPKTIERSVKRLFWPLIDSSEHRLYDQARRELLNDPERYLERLRGSG